MTLIDGISRLLEATQNAFSFTATYTPVGGESIAVAVAPETEEIEATSGEYPVSERRAAFSYSTNVFAATPQVGDLIAIERSGAVERYRVVSDKAFGVVWRWKHAGLNRTRRVVYCVEIPKGTVENG